MTLAQAWSFLQGALPVLTIVGTGGLLLLGTKFVRHGRCEEHRRAVQSGTEGHEARLTALEGKVAALQTTVSTLPRTEDVAEIKHKLSRVEGGLDAISGQMARAETQNAMILRHLLNRGARQEGA